MEDHNLNIEKTLMIGDSLQTDILFGLNNGIDTLLVESGVDSEKDVQQGQVVPKFIMDKLIIWTLWGNV